MKGKTFIRFYGGPYCDNRRKKNIELVWSDPLREVGFIANGMTTSELRERLEMEIRAWEMVVNKKSEG